MLIFHYRDGKLFIFCWLILDAFCGVLPSVDLIGSSFCCCLVTKLRLTLWDPMDYSPPGCSVHGISQVRILQWVAIPISRGSSQPMDWNHVSCSGRWTLYHPWATRNAQLGAVLAGINCLVFQKNLEESLPIPPYTHITFFGWRLAFGVIGGGSFCLPQDVVHSTLFYRMYFSSSSQFVLKAEHFC